MKFPEPVLSYAIEPKSRGDEDKINQAMHRLEEEDPTIRYSRDPQLLAADVDLDQLLHERNVTNTFGDCAQHEQSARARASGRDRRGELGAALGAKHVTGL